MAKTQLFIARDDPTQTEILVIHKPTQKVPAMDGWDLVEDVKDTQGVKKTYRRTTE